MSEDLKKAPIAGIPSPTMPKPPKAPSLAPTSKKSVVKQLEQVNTPQMKDLAMKQAKSVEASMKNPTAMTKDEGIKPYAPPSNPSEQHFHVVQNGQRLTTDPIPHSHIESKMGGVKRLEAAGYNLVPVAKEKLIKAPNGQWSLEKY